VRASVLAAFPKFTTGFEGHLNFMYLDQHVGPDGSPDPLVTTGDGDLIDPVGAALVLPWVHADGTTASSDEVTAEWTKIKSLKDLAPYGGNAFRDYTTLHLTEEAIASKVRAQLLANERILRNYFPDWDDWPADAQMGALSMAWAMGAGFPDGYPKFTQAANRGDWATAAAESTITRNPPRDRNAADKLLFLNAAASNDPETLYYPGKPGVSVAKVLTVLALLGVTGWGYWRLWKAL
jgi:hypothetical protein